MTPEAPMEALDIGVDALREWLESGRPVTVLDIRPPVQREEWSIPGSVPVDAQAAMRAGHSEGTGAATVAGVALRPGEPVVAVCAEGKTSPLAGRAKRG